MKIKFRVNLKERIYFAIMVIVSIAFYYYIFNLMTNHSFHIKGTSIEKLENTSAIIIQNTILFYVAIIIAFIIIANMVFIGYIRGNAVKISEKQLPEIFEILKKQSEDLNLSKIPSIYLIQGNGVLNAFATRFICKNYIVLHSEIVEEAYKKGIAAVEFIIGHELGHIKRKHISFFKTWFLFPSRLIPFLHSAYSRACEYTCDSIGHALCPNGFKPGMLMLAAGKELSSKVDVDEYLSSAKNDSGFVTWIAEIFSTHPHISKRVKALYKK